MCLRAQSGFPDPTPTLVDIERTHVLFVNAHFKPFVALAYEYNRVRSNAGSATFNTQVTFSIPQFGDFFADMVVNATLEATSATQGVVPALPAFIGVADQSVTATESVSGTENTVAGIYTQYTHQYTDLAGEVLSVGAAAANFVRYAEYPGERLFRRVKFEVYIPLASVCTKMHASTLLRNELALHVLTGLAATPLRPDRTMIALAS